MTFTLPRFDPVSVGVGAPIVLASAGATPAETLDDRLIRLGIRPAGTSPATTTPSETPTTGAETDADRAKRLRLTDPVTPTQEVRNAPADWLPQHPVAQFARSVNPFGLTDLAVAGTRVAGGAIDAARAGRPYDAGADLAISLGQIERDRRNFQAENPNLALAAQGTGVLGEMVTGGLADAAVGGLIRGGRAVIGGLSPRRAPPIRPEPGPVAPGLMATAVRGGASSAVLGGTEAFTAAPPESSWEDRWTRAGVGAAIGGPAGFVLTPVTQGLFDLTRGAFGTSRTLRGRGAEDTREVMAGRNPQISNPDEVGEMVHDMIERHSQAAIADADRFYARAGQLGTHVHDGSALGQRILTRMDDPDSGLNRATRFADPRLAGAREALELIEELSRRRGPVPVAREPVAAPSNVPGVGTLPNAGQATAVNPTRTTIGGDSLVDLQARLNSIVGRSPEDTAALTRIRQIWRESFDAMPATPGFLRDSTGAPATGEAVGLVQMGNQAWGRAQRLRGNTDDVPGQIIALWRDNGKTGAAIADDILALASRPQQVSKAVQVIERLRGELSPEQFNQIQQGLFLRQLGASATDQTPKAIRSNLYRLIDGDARVLGRAVFSNEQQQALRALYRAIPQGNQNLAVASAGRHGLGFLMATAGAALGFKMGLTSGSADAISNTVNLGATGGLMAGGWFAGETLGARLRTALRGDANDPVLNEPLLSQRVGRGTGIALGAEIGGIGSRTPPDKLHTLLPH